MNFIVPPQSICRYLQCVSRIILWMDIRFSCMTKMHNRRKLPCGHFTYVLAGESGEPPLGNLVREVKISIRQELLCFTDNKIPPKKNPHKVAQDFSSQKHPAHKTRTRLYLGKVCWAPKVAGSSAQDPSTRRAQDHPKKCPKPTISAEHYAQDAHNIRTTPRTRRLRLANILESAQDVRTRPSAQDFAQDRAHKTI